MNTAIFTICARNFLAYATTLRDSVKAVHPDRPFFIFLADEAGETVEGLPPEVIPVSEIAIPNLMDMAFRYSLMEFSTAVKADCFLHLLREREFDSAIFLDPDIYVYAPLAEVFAALTSGASLVVTPHLLKADKASHRGRDMDVLRSGTFNLGFLAVRASEESFHFLEWWSGRLRSDCYSAPESGLFVDQRFVDMAPGFIERLEVIRHPGYNVAYWNLHERTLAKSGSSIEVDGCPLVFFHFSGVSPTEPRTLSKHLGASQPSMGSAVSGLVSRYIDHLNAHGQVTWSRQAYAYGSFSNGMPILLPMRRNPPRSGGPAAWFESPDIEFWNSPDPEIVQSSGLHITRLMGAYLRMRPDLMKLFPMSTQSGRRTFIGWFCRHGVREYSIPPVFVPPSDARVFRSTGIMSRLRQVSRLFARQD